MYPFSKYNYAKKESPGQSNNRRATCWLACKHETCKGPILPARKLKLRELSSLLELMSSHGACHVLMAQKDMDAGCWGLGLAHLESFISEPQMH